MQGLVIRNHTFVIFNATFAMFFCDTDLIMHQNVISSRCKMFRCKEASSYVMLTISVSASLENDVELKPSIKFWF